MIKYRDPKIAIGWGSVFILLIACDQLAKSLAGHLYLNHWFAFSLPLPVVLMYLIYILVLSAIVIYCTLNFAKFNRIQVVSWLLILAGVVSNIGERIALGYVRDYIYILNGVFNLADGYIILGILILLFSSRKKISN